MILNNEVIHESKKMISVEDVKKEMKKIKRYGDKTKMFDALIELFVKILASLSAIFSVTGTMVGTGITIVGGTIILLAQLPLVLTAALALYSPAVGSKAKLQKLRNKIQLEKEKADKSGADKRYIAELDNCINMIDNTMWSKVKDDE